MIHYTGLMCILLQYREVSRSEMESLADEYSVPLMETSSAEDIDSVEAVFRAAVKKALLLKVSVVHIVCDTLNAFEMYSSVLSPLFL